MTTPLFPRVTTTPINISPNRRHAILNEEILIHFTCLNKRHQPPQLSLHSIDNNVLSSELLVSAALPPLLHRAECPRRDLSLSLLFCSTLFGSIVNRRDSSRSMLSARRKRMCDTLSRKIPATVWTTNVRRHSSLSIIKHLLVSFSLHSASTSILSLRLHSAIKRTSPAK